MIILHKKTAGGIALAALFALSVGASGLAGEFSYDAEALPGAKPWTSANFKDDSETFQFVIIGDLRTRGGPAQSSSARVRHQCRRHDRGLQR
jgi:hypothetical protein